MTMTHVPVMKVIIKTAKQLLLFIKSNHLNFLLNNISL